MKQCSKCEKFKNASEFLARANGKSRAECKTCSRLVRKVWREANKEKMSVYKAKYRKTHPERCLKSYHASIAKRRKLDSVFDLSVRVRDAVRLSIRKLGYTKRHRTFKIVGMEHRELLDYLWSKFEEHYGLPRAFIGLAQVHIDHILPISLAKTEEDVIRLNHHSNLQFLLIEDNLSKGARIE